MSLLPQAKSTAELAQKFHNASYVVGYIRTLICKAVELGLTWHTKRNVEHTEKANILGF